MIIFDLDGTLADCEHRRHFVDDRYFPPDCKECENTGVTLGGICYCYHGHPVDIPDWEAFYEACEQDRPIEAVVEMFHTLHAQEKHVQIWSGRCESVREKTYQWLLDHVDLKYITRFCGDADLKMRPIGDNTPDDQLKERWLDETLRENRTVDFVFDNSPKVVAMWRRRGIFVFDCNQTGNEF